MMTRLRLDLQFFAGEKTEKATPKKKGGIHVKRTGCQKHRRQYSHLISINLFLSFFFIGPFYERADYRAHRTFLFNNHANEG
ncbi:hypothetical protein BsIDN1_29900 [Bacillus safensis]|uniref:Uncharacterized protein n=1 Tax=Bacillus safensis TaxID=561879 RepID=A0A5S9M9X0_BACIA|nr:hypothetical protein BsIDN1_29900 [Bacillus safensis]